MPTPRVVSEVMRTARQPGTGGSANKPPQGDWIAATVQSSNGAINAVHQVSLSSGGVVAASSSLDFPITPGSTVWVVRASGGYVVAGVR